jgi:hypothetical protein
MLNSRFVYARSARSKYGPMHIVNSNQITETCREVKMLCGVIARRYQQTTWHSYDQLYNPPCERCQRIYIMLDLGGLLDV